MINYTDESSVVCRVFVDDRFSDYERMYIIRETTARAAGEKSTNDRRHVARISYSSIMPVVHISYEMNDV